MSVNRNNIINKIKPAGSTGAEYTIAPTIMVDSNTNYTASLPTLTEDSKLLLSAVSVTYAQLAVLISNNQLLAGSFYRITDFVTTTAQARTQSAGHQFDLIVHAISNNELSEDASACLHAGDSYFANSNLKAWVLKYSFANDTSRFAWADTANGKGVIYYMRDEFYNECSYDFKNIQFARYKTTACPNCSALVGRYIGVLHHTSGQAILTSYMTLDTSDYKYYYTFDLCQTDYSLNAIGTTVVTPDGNVTLNQIQCTKCLICADENDAAKYYLNNAVILLENSRDCMIRITGWCQNNTFLGGAGVMDICNAYSSIIGGGTSTSFNGYIGTNSHIENIGNVLAFMPKASCYVASNSRIGTMQYDCLIGGTGDMIVSSSVNILVQSTLISTGSALISQSMIGMINSCTITCSSAIIVRSNIAYLASCTGQGASIYLYMCRGAQIYGISMYDTSLGSVFLQEVSASYFSGCTLTSASNCVITHLKDSTLRRLSGCTFINSENVTCTQDLKGCNFGDNVNYITLSSSTTSQTITNTNIHDISGTSSSSKSVVIPEDYTNPHTVEIYSSEQYRVYEID